jgi:hypothetical protein
MDGRSQPEDDKVPSQTNADKVPKGHSDDYLVTEEGFFFFFRLRALLTVWGKS